MCSAPPGCYLAYKTIGITPQLSPFILFTYSQSVCSTSDVQWNNSECLFPALDLKFDSLQCTWDKLAFFLRPLLEEIDFVSSKQTPYLYLDIKMECGNLSLAARKSAKRKVGPIYFSQLWGGENEQSRASWKEGWKKGKWEVIWEKMRERVVGVEQRSKESSEICLGVSNYPGCLAS